MTELQIMVLSAAFDISKAEAVHNPRDNAFFTYSDLMDHLHLHPVAIWVALQHLIEDGHIMQDGHFLYIWPQYLTRYNNGKDFSESIID